jgi:hypothetical protein
MLQESRGMVQTETVPAGIFGGTRRRRFARYAQREANEAHRKSRHFHHLASEGLPSICLELPHVLGGFPIKVAGQGEYPALFKD